MAKPTPRKRTTGTHRGEPTRRELAALPLVIGAIASGRAEAQTGLAIENASLTEVLQALADGKTNASALTKNTTRRVDGGLTHRLRRRW